MKISSCSLADPSVSLVYSHGCHNLCPMHDSLMIANQIYGIIISLPQTYLNHIERPVPYFLYIIGWKGMVDFMKASRQQIRRAIASQKNKQREQAALIQELQHQLRVYEQMYGSCGAGEDVRKANAQKAALIDSINELILVFDHELRYVEVHAPNRELLLMPPHDLVGKTIAESGIEEPAYTPLREAMEAAIGAGKSSLVEYWLDLPAGRRWFEARITPLRYPDGSCHGAIDVVRDITDRKVMEENLRKEKKRAEASDRAKSLFLANMSHELRTPLNGLMGMTQLLALTNLTKEQQDLVNGTLTSCSAMTNVINDILNYTHLDRGFETAVNQPFNLKALVDEVMKLHLSAALSKGLALRCSISPSVPEEMVGDAQKIQQILNHLVGNAIKFTPEGQVRLEVSLQEPEPSSPRNNGQVWAAFKVQDTGIGIPEKMQEAIFQRFNQVDNSHRRSAGGVGLGLTIARELAHTIQGTIEVQSQLGEGSCFSLICPLAPLSPSETMADEPGVPAERQDSSKADDPKDEPQLQKNILVVDDDPFSLLSMSKMLTKLGYAVTTASNGQEAVALVESGGSPFHVIFMDLQMPVLDGWDATVQIRGLQKANRHRPLIVALTGAVLPESRQKCREAGMDDFLTKPLSFDHLVDKLKEWL